MVKYTYNPHINYCLANISHVGCLALFPWYPLDTKKTVKLIHSLDPPFLYSLLFFQNISNKHLGTSGAKAIASLLLENLSYLNVFQLLQGCMHTNTVGSRSEEICVSFQSLTLKILLGLWAKSISHLCL